MKSIRVSRLAERDLDEIWYHIAKNSSSIETANGVIDSITAKFPVLARAPLSGTLRDEIDPGVRTLPVGKYIIYYRESARRLVISRVIHGMREQRTAFLNED